MQDFVHQPSYPIPNALELRACQACTVRNLQVMAAPSLQGSWFMGLWFGVSTVGFMVWGLGLGFRLEVRYSAVVRQP